MNWQRTVYQSDKNTWQLLTPPVNVTEAVGRDENEVSANDDAAAVRHQLRNVPSLKYEHSHACVPRIVTLLKRFEMGIACKINDTSDHKLTITSKMARPLACVWFCTESGLVFKQIESGQDICIDHWITLESMKMSRHLLVPWNHRRWSLIKQMWIFSERVRKGCLTLQLSIQWCQAMSGS